jgi:hypothetical protein
MGQILLETDERIFRKECAKEIVSLSVDEGLRPGYLWQIRFRASLSAQTRTVRHLLSFKTTPFSSQMQLHV